MAAKDLAGTAAVASEPQPHRGAGPSEEDLAVQLAGLDALEAALGRGPSRTRRVWSSAWPKVAAVVLALAVWQVVAWSHWKPEYALPGPRRALSELRDLLSQGAFWKAIGLTMRRAVTGYALAVVIGSAVGLAVTRVKPLRTAVGSLITGLMTMPSIVWLPLAILLFQLSERAIP